MKKGNVITSRFFSTLLASALLSGVVLSAPVAYAEEAVALKSVEEVNYVGYRLTATTDTILIDLADKYFYQFAFVDVKKKVRVNGQMVPRYVRVDLVILDLYGRSTIKTNVGIKLGDTIRVSIAAMPYDEIVRWQLVK